MNAHVAARVFPPYAPPAPTPTMPHRRLTKRQRQLIDLLVEKRSVVYAARALGMSIHTARAHVRSIANRLPNPHGLPAYKLILAYFEDLPPLG